MIWIIFTTAYYIIFVSDLQSIQTRSYKNILTLSVLEQIQVAISAKRTDVKDVWVSRKRPCNFMSSRLNGVLNIAKKGLTDTKSARNNLNSAMTTTIV